MARGKLIDPSQFPLKSVDLDVFSMQTSSDGLGSAGTAMVTAMGEIETSWSRLPGVYEAPEADRVYALMVPAVTAASEVDDVFTRASTHLDAYVQVLSLVKPDLEDLETRAAAFRKDVKDGVSIPQSQKVWASPHMDPQARQDFNESRITVEWHEDDATNQKNTALLAEYDEICGKILTASSECAGALQGLLSAGARVGLHPGGGPGAAARDYAPVSMEQPAWGYPGDTDRSICESASLGIINFGRNTVNGIGGLFGYNIETGWHWSTAGQSWGGLGNLAGSLVVASITPVQVVSAAMKGSGNENGFTGWVDERNTAVRDTGAAIIGYDPYADDGWHQWKQDPTAMATEMGLNVLTCLIPGADVAAGLKAGSGAARAARIAGEAADFVVPFGSQMVKGGLTVIRGADDVAGVAATTTSLASGAARGGVLQVTIHSVDVQSPSHQPSINGSIRPPHIDNPSIGTFASTDPHLPAATKPHGIDTHVLTPHGNGAPSAPHDIVSGAGSGRTPYDASRLYDADGPLIHEPSAAERAAGQPVTNQHHTHAQVPVPERELALVGARPGEVTNSTSTVTPVRPPSTISGAPHTQTAGGAHDVGGSSRTGGSGGGRGPGGSLGGGLPPDGHAPGPGVHPGSGRPLWDPEAPVKETMGVKEATEGKNPVPKYTEADVVRAERSAPVNAEGKPVDHRTGIPLKEAGPDGKRPWDMAYDPEAGEWVAQNKGDGLSDTGGMPQRGEANSFGYDEHGNLMQYADQRPNYAKGQVKEVWKRASDAWEWNPATKDWDRVPGAPDRVMVTDIDGNDKWVYWDPTASPPETRIGKWDMGHLPDHEYRDLRSQYLNHEISLEEFLEEYRNPRNYQVEDPSRNRSHKDEGGS